MKNYRNAFVVTLITAMVLATGLAYIGWRYILSAQAPVAASAAATAATAATEDPPAQGEAAPTESSTTQTPLAPIQIGPQRMQEIGVTTGTVAIQPAFNEIRTVGNVAVDEQLVSTVQLRFGGWIQKVFANSTYQYVRKGQPLFTIYSPDLVTTENEYLIARKNQGLLSQSGVPGVATGADSLLASAGDRLKLWQVPDREIAHLKETGQARNELEIDSPVSGYITELNALPQQFVQPQTRLYTIANLSTVWVYADVFQNDIGQVRRGDPASITVDAYPGRVFGGRVDYIWPQVDMTTRTVKVRFVFRNPGIKLTPGMFVNVNLKTPLGNHLLIPSSGVFHAGTRDLAFLYSADGYIRPREIELGPQTNDGYVVLKGLQAGNRIVTSANFLIDSESQLQAAIGAFAPPPPAPGTATSAAPNTISFSSIPSPPHKGSNEFHVKLTDTTGLGISAAQVQITFYMPAMPAMGMAAMKAVFTLADKGNGNYEGQGTLPTEGNWQVTVVARRADQIVANKQFSISSSGGM